MGFFKDMNMSKYDLPFILFLLIVTLILTVKMIIFNYHLGVYCSDVYIYLLNSLNFAGLNLNGESSMYLSPVICFCTSILFRLGYMDITSIYIVTGAFAIFGVIGFYFLLRYRFNKILSLIGSVLLFSLSLNLLWLANGTLDVPAVGLTIWTILFFVLAVDKNPKYYFLAFLFFIIGIFTRYTVVLILPAMLVYFLCKHDIFNGLDNLISDRSSLKTQVKDFCKSKEAKYILIVLMICLILLLSGIIIVDLFSVSFSPSYLLNAFNSGFSANKHDRAYSTNTLFYIINFLNFLFANKVTINNDFPIISTPNIISYLVMFITIFGLATGILSKFKNIQLKKGEKLIENQKTFKTKKLSLALNIIFIILLITAILSLGKVSSTVTILLFTVSIIILFKILKKYEIKDLNFHLMLLTWFLTYLISFSLIHIKVNRYIITLMPAFIYFFILGLYYVEKQWNYDFKLSNHKISTSQILAILLIVIFIFSAFNFTSTVTSHLASKDQIIISDFIKHYDSHYQDKHIGVDDERAYPWYLKMKICPISQQNFKSFYDKNLTYYITSEKVDNLTGYHLLKNQGQIYLYGKS